MIFFLAHLGPHTCEPHELKSPNSVKTKSETYRLKVYETTKERRVLESEVRLENFFLDNNDNDEKQQNKLIKKMLHYYQWLTQLDITPKMKSRIAHIRTQFVEIKLGEEVISFRTY